MKGLFVVAALLLALVSLAQAACTDTDFCRCTTDPTCQGCVNGGVFICQTAGGNSTCNGTPYSGSTASTMCNNFRSCSAATSACDCVKRTNCGFCNAAGGASCVGGTSTVALESGKSCSSSDYLTSSSTQLTNQCKLQKAQIIGKVVAGVGVPVVLIIYAIVWWCVRGKWWWHSTTHERCCYSETACCNGCLCFRPYPAQPPPHGKSSGPKSTASRVAPCWTANPCALCDNLDGWVDKKTGKPKGDTYRPLHKCGLGYACACAWMPGACCFMWPEKCRQNCCEDVQDGPIGKTPAGGAKPADGAAAGADGAPADGKKGKWANKMKKKKGADAAA